MDALVKERMERLFGAELSAKAELVLIDQSVYKRGPDGLWYRLDEEDDDDGSA